MNNLEKVIDKNIKKYNNGKICFEVNNDRELINALLKILEDKGYKWVNGALPTEFMPLPYTYSIDLNLYANQDDSISYSDKKSDGKGLNYVKYDELKEVKKKKVTNKIIKDVNSDNVKNILILKPYTVVYFTDGDIFVACCDDEDEFNEDVGIAICKIKKMIKDEKEKLEKLKRKLEEQMKFSERRIEYGREFLREINK